MVADNRSMADSRHTEKLAVHEAGRFIGVGVGPGDPELLTLKAARLIRSADVISYLANRSGQSQARHIARDVLADPDKEQQFLPLLMPMSEDRSVANQVYDKAWIDIRAALATGKCVVFLCEGDPLFFGSFAYLLKRLNDEQASENGAGGNRAASDSGDSSQTSESYPSGDYHPGANYSGGNHHGGNHHGGNYCCEVVPGISSVHAAAATLQYPLTVLKESFAVLSGRHDSDQLIATLHGCDSVVIMKAGRSRPKILDALRQTDRINEAAYLEYIGRDNQYIEKDVSQLADEAGPYFSLFVVTRSDRQI